MEQRHLEINLPHEGLTSYEVEGGEQDLRKGPQQWILQWKVRQGKPE